jgi:hypothetical protein
VEPSVAPDGTLVALSKAWRPDPWSQPFSTRSTPATSSGALRERSGGGNDAGGVQVYAQMGQDYGMKLLWTLMLLFPVVINAVTVVVIEFIGGSTSRGS